MTNMDSLCSVSKKYDSGALRDILLSLRECCNHPYLVDVSLQSMQRKGLSEVEFLDADINASSRLQLLDNILSELKIRRPKGVDSFPDDWTIWANFHW